MGGERRVRFSGEGADPGHPSQVQCGCRGAWEPHSGESSQGSVSQCGLWGPSVENGVSGYLPGTR